jgi:hypothetical protein
LDFQTGVKTQFAHKLKHRGGLCKIYKSGIFKIIFLNKKAMEWVYVVVDHVHANGAWVHRPH